MTEWLPIETAPKNETEVLLYDKNYTDSISGVFVGSYCAHEGCFKDTRPDGWRLYPTHWMPLPCQPKDNWEAVASSQIDKLAVAVDFTMRLERYAEDTGNMFLLKKARETLSKIKGN